MRRFLKALLILVIGLPVIAAVGYWYLQQQITQAGISDLQLDVNRLTLTSVSFAKVRFKLQQNGATHQVDLKNVELSWQWQQAFKPALQQVTVGPGQISLARLASQPATANDQAALILPSQWQLPAWLPRHIGISDITLLLPCATGHCPLQLNGYLTYHNGAVTTGQTDNGNPAYWQSQLIISSNPLSAEPELSELVIDAHYQPSPQPTLVLTIQQQQQIGLSLKQQINPASQLAITELALALSPPSSANQTLLQQWGIPLPEAWLAQFQQPVQLYSKLNWQLPVDGNLASMLSNHDINGIVIARVPDPFLLPQLGFIQGELNAELSLKNQVVERWQLNANGTVTDLVLPAAVTDYGITLKPVQFTLSSQATDPLNPEPLNLSALPLQLSVNSSGANSFSLNSELTVNLSASPRLDFTKARLTTTMAKLGLPDDSIRLQNLQLNTELSGHWQADNWQIRLQDDSQLSLAVQHPEFSIGKLTLTLLDTELQQAAATTLQLTSNVSASISHLQHAALQQQNWQWQAATKFERLTDDSILSLQGTLSNDSGLSVLHQLNWQDAALSASWQLADLFMLAGNPLASTFNDWPALLELNRGRLGANGQLHWLAGQLTGRNQLQLRDLAGIYDRSLFQGMSADISLTLLPEQVQLTTDNLVVNYINHGLEAGPLQLAAHYQSTLELPAKGVLALDQLTLQLMGGTLSAAAQQLDFSQSQNQVKLQLSQLDLGQLLQQHPSTDIKGQGKLSGTIPINLSPAGFTVEDGRIAADKPGGKIQYRSAAVSGMGVANQSMQTVFSALEDFHFSVLASEVSYDTSGRLLLALNLQGLNPALQQGRAINLNINLEEDLPAMITSLQLTNKLNDTITKRVQQYIQQKQAAEAAAGAKK